jgi:hypothetical protein
MGAAEELDELFGAVREAAGAAIWSRGVEVARGGIVRGESESAGEIAVRVATRGGLISRLVRLYPADADWECDCKSPDAACEHVAAAVIALRRAREAGERLPGAGAGTRAVGSIGYRFARAPGGLALERVVVVGESEVALAGTLAAASSGRTGAPAFTATPRDLAVEQALGSNLAGAVARERMARLLGALAGCDDVRLDGAAIAVDKAPVLPIVRVEDRGDGFALVLAPDPELRERFANGAAVASGVLRPLGEPSLSLRERAELPQGQYWAPERVAELVTEVLPALRTRLPVAVATARLPETSEEPPRVVLDVRRDGDALSVLATLVYGDPPRARVDGGRLVHLTGAIPLRDEAGERRALRGLERDLGLEPGHRVDVTGTEAVDLAERIRAFPGEVRGRAHQEFRRAAALVPRVQLDGERVDVWFEGEPAEAGGPSRRVEAGAALRAWRESESLVPLAGGGFAPLPADWLAQHAERVADLLAAREEDGAVPRALLPDLARLCDDLELPRPPGFERIAALVGDFAGIPAAPLPVDLTATLRGYQRAGVDWLHFLRSAGLGGVLADDMGLGKAQPLDALVLTPKGWRVLGEIRVGDEVIGSDGRPTPVLAVYPQGEKQVFRVTFSDGAQVECCDEHLWSVNTALRRKRGAPFRVLPLREIRQRLHDGAGNRQYFVPLVQPVQFPRQELAVDPYLLGALLGDGCLRHRRVDLSTADSDLLEHVAALLPPGVRVVRRAPGHCDYGLRSGARGVRNPLRRALAALGLVEHGSDTKFVPEPYLLGSIDQRLSLLQGLLDTDGYVGKDGTVQFSSNSAALVRGVREIVQSLGGVGRSSSKISLSGKRHHVLTIALPNGVIPFRVARKRARLRPRRKYPPARAFSSVESMGTKPCCCIRVGAADQLYVTTDFVVTHNTVQALGTIAGRTLVVCPTSVLQNWLDECARFRPALRARAYHRAGRALDPDADVTVTTWAILRLDADALAEVAWDTAILDEAQAVKNPDSQVARAAYRLRAGFKLALTGTPVENRLEELWSLFHFANRGLLGGRSDFETRYARPIRDGAQDAAERLRERIRPFLLRRRKRDVAPELPPRTEITLRCELEPAERAVYDAVRAATRAEVVEKLRAGGSVLEALEALLRLRQAACHPALVPGAHAETSSKLELLVETLEEVLAEGHKALVFSQWTGLLDLVEPRLRAAGLDFLRLDGSTRDRAGVVARFQQESGPPVFLISLRAGGTGLNLTAADHVFLLDPWWNPAVEDQAADRAHRIGQERPVLIQRLVARDTVEEGMLALQARKRALADAALADAGAAASLTREDLLGLLA